MIQRLAISLALLATAATSAPETRMKAAIATEAPRHEALLEKLVRQNSGSLNLAGVKAVGEMMRAELEPLGFAVEWVDMTATCGPGISWRRTAATAAASACC